MPLFNVTVRETHVFELQIEAADRAAAKAEALRVLHDEGRSADRLQIDVEDWDVVEAAPPRGIRTIVFDDDGTPRELGDLDVGQLHDVIGKAVGEIENMTDGGLKLIVVSVMVGVAMLVTIEFVVRVPRVGSFEWVQCVQQADVLLSATRDDHATMAIKVCQAQAASR